MGYNTKNYTEQGGEKTVIAGKLDITGDGKLTFSGDPLSKALYQSDSEAVDITLGIPIETGIFSGKAPEEYLVITPMNDLFDLYADNLPQAETQEARVSLFTKYNYMARKNEIVNLLLGADFTISDRRYLGFEEDTGFHHFAIDVAKEYLRNQ